MSTRQNIKKTHRCIAALCKGRMAPGPYGYWAYWNPVKSTWQPTPVDASESEARA